MYRRTEMYNDNRLIHIDVSLKQSLQHQIRQKLVEGILAGSFAVGSRLPSSRKLANQLQVSRNTVVIVYQQLMDEGYILSRERSGIYVSDEFQKGRLNFQQRPIQTNNKLLDHKSRFKGSVATSFVKSSPTNWRNYKYPFIDGKFDSSLYPVKEWRDASNMANTTSDIAQWSELHGLEDDPMLIDEIRTKILPRRGIQSTADEILITVGNRQALHLVCMLFVDNTTTVAVEEPGYPEFRDLLKLQGATIISQNVDDKGIVVDENLDQCNIIYTTPSHQTPTSITMSLARRDELLTKAKRKDFLIIEDDFEFESNFLGQPHPALRSLDNDNRVVYISCLSKVLASGVQIGFVVADSHVISELKKIRKMILHNPPYNNQRAVAYFLSQGYYDAYMMHLHKTFFERWLTLREALNIYLPNCVDTGPIQGGTAYWITGPEQLDGEYLREKAAEIGILIEPVKHYFSTADYPENCFRMGITSIPNNRIQEGVKKLAELIHQLTEDYEENLGNAKGHLLSELELETLLPDIILECQMVYGVPCTIELCSDGNMIGHTGGKDNEDDVGRWWIKDGMYYRQWNLWGYGYIKGFHVIMDGDKMKWFDSDNRFVRELDLKNNTSKLDL